MTPPGAKMDVDMKPVPAAALAFLAYFAGGFVAPALFPYKMFGSDTANEIIMMRIESLYRSDTYFGSYALQGYCGLVIIFMFVYGLFELRFRYLLIAFFFVLGVYYDLMLDGAMVGRAHAWFDDLVRSPVPSVTEMPLYLLFPLAIMLGAPLAVGYALSKAQSYLGAQGPRPPDRKNGGGNPV